MVVPVERAGKAKMDDLATKAVLPKNLLNTIEQLIDLVPGIPPPTIRVKFALERNRKNRTSEKMWGQEIGEEGDEIEQKDKPDYNIVILYLTVARYSRE